MNFQCATQNFEFRTLLKNKTPETRAKRTDRSFV